MRQGDPAVCENLRDRSVGPGVSVKVVDRILELLAEIRGAAAVEALLIA